MTKQDIEDLITRICHARYEWKGSTGNSYDSLVLGGSTQINAIEKVVYEWWAEKSSEEGAYDLGELKAKCYTYEQIIANSNFAPMIKSESLKAVEEKRERIKELLADLNEEEIAIHEIEDWGAEWLLNWKAELERAIKEQKNG